MADGISGSVELSQQVSENKTKDATGLSTESRSHDYLQRYSLSFNNMLYPFLNLRGGVRLDKESSDSESDGSTSKATSINIMPSVALTLANPFVYAGISYDKQEQTQGGLLATSSTNIRETRSAYLGFKPEGLPTLDMRLSKSATYDKERVSTDQVSTTVQINSRYAPIKNLDLSYQATSSDGEDRLTSIESVALSQSVRAGYSTRFFKDRVTLSTNYIVNLQEVKTTSSSGAGGMTMLQLFPVAGLSSINETPILGTLNVNLSLIDGVLVTSSGINIGQLPSLGGDSTKRNVGLDFGTETEVNDLFVWVDRNLPTSIAGSFVWDIYISSDNLNWSLYQTGIAATFGQFDNRFEIAFTNVKTRYIKAVTRPLSVAVAIPLGVDVTNIFITELQAFLEKSAAQSDVSKSTQRSQLFDLSGRLNIFASDTQSLFYDIYYQDHNSQQDDQHSQSSMLVNALIASQRFSKVLTGSAKVTRENDKNVDGSSTGKAIYDASLVATGNSLPKLSHNLVVTGRNEVDDGTASDTETLFLYNNAEIYPGIDVSLTGGETLATSTTGTHNVSTMVNCGATVVPHKALSINMYYDRTVSKQSGNGVTPSTSIRQSSSASVSFNPFSSLYLVGSIATIDETDKPHQTTRNVGISWSLQPSGGALQLSFTYNENISPDDQTKTRTMGPSIRWKINNSAILNVSYQIVTSEGQSTTTQAQYFSTNFRMML
jgi:hypothetical protein